MGHSALLVLQFPKLLLYLSSPLALRVSVCESGRQILYSYGDVVLQTTDRICFLRSFQASVCVKHSSQTEHIVIDTELKL